MYQMQKFRKKPVVIEAIKFDGTQHNRDDIEKWLGQNNVQNGNWFYDGKQYASFEIFTLEGWFTATVGDMIIKGVANDVYPCKPAIFEATYEKVES